MNPNQILGDGTLAAAVRHHIRELPEDILICAIDTPIGNGGRPDCEFVIRTLTREIHQREQAISYPTISDITVVIMSQLPVGTCKSFEEMFPRHKFIVFPENIRAAHAVEDFGNQPRIVLGCRDKSIALDLADTIFKPFSDCDIVTDPETAEMVKHGLNGFLALSIAYAQELARIAEAHHADPHVLAEALMSDPRIGPKAYLKPGGGLGAHLKREVWNLLDLGAGDLIRAVSQLE